jgi:hypothetical protein
MGGNLQGRGAWLLGAAAVIVIAVAGYFILQRPTPDPVEPPASVAAIPPEPAVTPESAVPPDPAAKPAPDATPEPAATPEPDPEPAAVPEVTAPLMPSFDVVRIKPDGGAVVAGRTEPAVPVGVLVDDKLTAEATADGDGNFVALFDLPPAEVTRVMTLRATLPDGSVIMSEQSVIIEAVAPVVVATAPEADTPADPAPEPDAVADVVADAGPASETDTPPTATPDPGTAPAADPATDSVAAQPGDQPDSATAAPEVAAAPDTIEPAPAADTAPDVVAALDTAPDPVPPVEPEAPRVLLAGPDGITVLQGRAPDASGLSIDTISYDDEGEVALAGRGGAAGRLQIYLDNLPVRAAEIGPDGQWRAPLPEVVPGVYTLRVDALGADGAVTSRVETPFKREDPAVLEAAQAEADLAVAAGRRIASITVQKDDTLWAIARDRYGEGMLYVKVFEANRAHIRDPHWIYPGQVFTLPDDADTPTSK